MAASGACVLATVAVFTTMQGLVLVLIYINFLLGTFVDVICEYTDKMKKKVNTFKIMC